MALCACGCGQVIPPRIGGSRSSRWRARCRPGRLLPGHRIRTPEAETRRFWSHVNKTETCWLWDKPKPGPTGGYGKMRWRGRSRPSHVISWEIANGPVPVGLFVCHRCDVRACVRPDHLFLGTQQDNIRDCSQKGRISRGEHRPHHKITESDVLSIRAQKAAGKSSYRLAAEFGISRPMVMQIVHRRRWAHVI